MYSAYTNRPNIAAEYSYSYENVSHKPTISAST
jgi:hypothetical protein